MRFLRSRRPKPARAEPLFDEAFLARLSYLEIVAKRAFRGSQRGERRSRKLGAGVEFADYRRYSPGDDFRHIDWNVFSRLGKLLLRLYEEEEDLTVHVLVDVSASMGVGDGARFDQARRLAAALSYVALANLDRVSVVPFADGVSARLLPVRGKAQVFRILDFLRQLEPGGTTAMGESLATVVQQSARRGLAVVLSDFYASDGYEDALNLLRYHRFEPLVIHLTDKRELSPRLRGDLQLVDCETEEIREVTVTPALLATYRQAHEDWRRELELFCTERHMPYFQAPVHVPFDELVLSLFRAGGFLR